MAQIRAAIFNKYREQDQEMIDTHVEKIMKLVAVPDDQWHDTRAYIRGMFWGRTHKVIEQTCEYLGVDPNETEDGE